MPLYEYRCEACGHEMELLVARMGEDPGEACEKCGKKSLKRKLSTFAAHSASPAAGPPKGEKCGSCSDGACPYAGGG